MPKFAPNMVWCCVTGSSPSSSSSSASDSVIENICLIGEQDTALRRDRLRLLKLRLGHSNLALLCTGGQDTPRPLSSDADDVELMLLELGCRDRVPAGSRCFDRPSRSAADDTLLSEDLS